MSSLGVSQLISILGQLPVKIYSVKYFSKYCFVVKICTCMCRTMCTLQRGSAADMSIYLM